MNRLSFRKKVAMKKQGVGVGVVVRGRGVRRLQVDQDEEAK